MIYPRLKIARELLKDDGVIFISIDDNEQARLKLVCDEIFGEENFVSDLIWIKKHGPGGNTSFNYKIINNVEYVLCYARKYDSLNMNYIVHNKEALKNLKYINKDKYFDERGYYKLTHLYHPSSTGSFQYTESLDYPIKAPDGSSFYLHCNKDGVKRGCYTWGYDTYLAGEKLGFIECKKNNDGDWVAFRKQYQYVKFDPKTKKIIKIDAGQPYENVIDDFYSSAGGAEIVKIFNDKNIFDFPKPTSLIKHLLKIGSKQNSLILDFFAGSGTTGQAVMELNKEDGGNRKYILVQSPEEIKDNNEFKYISDITRERIARSIKMFDYSEKGFKFFKQTSTNFNKIEIDKNESINQLLLDFKENTFKEDRTQEDILYQIILLSGFNLNTKFNSKTIQNNKVFVDETNKIIIAIDNQKYINIENTIQDIYKQNNNKGTLVVYLVDQNFKNDQDKINSIKTIETKIKSIDIRII